MASTRVAVVVHDCLTIIKVIVLGIIAVSGVLVTVGAIHIPSKFQLSPLSLFFVMMKLNIRTLSLPSSVPLSDRPDNFSNPFATVSTNGGAYAAAFFKIFWAYDGWNNLNYAVAELDNPSKNLPRAAGMGVLL